MSEAQLFRPLLSGPSDDEVTAAETVLADRRTALAQQSADSLVKCSGSVLGGGCGAMLRIGDLTYIQVQLYDSGDRHSGWSGYRDGEGRFDCPKCGNRNRLFDRKEVMALRRFFKAETTTDEGNW